MWRGTNRVAEVVFGNVADRDDMPDHEFVPSQEGLWRFVVDLPFDEGEYGPVDDANRIRDLRDNHRERSRTLAWLPTHLSAARRHDFERLVVIHYALADERRFDTMYAGHLNADSRARAKVLLEGQRDSLLKTLKASFKQAYGCADNAPTTSTCRSRTTSLRCRRSVNCASPSGSRCVMPSATSGRRCWPTSSPPTRTSTRTARGLRSSPPTRVSSSG
ncbi:hypothetical protein ACU686_29620 [Yinghuangia aomiensis]